MFQYDSDDLGWPRQLFRNLRSKQAWRFVLACLFYLSVPVLLVLPLFTQEPPAFFCVACAIGSPVVGRYLIQTWMRCNRAGAKEAQIVDTRPPILYLRPFESDSVKFISSSDRARRAKHYRETGRRVAGRNFPYGMIWAFMLELFLADLLASLPLGGQRGEEFLIEPLELLGPVIAIGRPGEQVPPLGAARVYLGENWQDVVLDYLKRAQLILLFAGSTPNFVWELGKVFGNRPFVPTLMMLPFFEVYSQPAVDQFRACFSEVSGLELPEDLSLARAIYFQECTRYDVIEEQSYNDVALNYINPFLGSIARVIELKHPGWSQVYLEDAEQKFAAENS